MLITVVRQGGTGRICRRRFGRAGWSLLYLGDLLYCGRRQPYAQQRRAELVEWASESLPSRIDRRPSVSLLSVRAGRTERRPHRCALSHRTPPTALTARRLFHSATACAIESALSQMAGVWWCSVCIPSSAELWLASHWR